MARLYGPACRSRNIVTVIGISMFFQNFCKKGHARFQNIHGLPYACEHYRHGLMSRGQTVQNDRHSTFFHPLNPLQIPALLGHGPMNLGISRNIGRRHLTTAARDDAVTWHRHARDVPRPIYRGRRMDPACRSRCQEFLRYMRYLQYQQERHSESIACWMGSMTHDPKKAGPAVGYDAQDLREWAPRALPDMRISTAPSRACHGCGRYRCLRGFNTMVASGQGVW